MFLTSILDDDQLSDTPFRRPDAIKPTALPGRPYSTGYYQAGRTGRHGHYQAVQGVMATTRPHMASTGL